MRLTKVSGLLNRLYKTPVIGSLAGTARGHKTRYIQNIMKRIRSNSWGPVHTVVGIVAALIFFAKLATNKNASPAAQFIAQTAESTLIQDIAKGLFGSFV